jgi:hypothetical protein
VKADWPPSAEVLLQLSIGEIKPMKGGIRKLPMDGEPQINPNAPVRGRPFVKGNSGRNPGSRNRATVIASGLLGSDAEALVRIAVELAKAGDVPMLRFLLGRILPRDRTIKFDLPQMDFADDGVAALGQIMRAVSEGAMTPAEGAQFAAIVNSYTAAIDMADVVKRVSQR